ncbi:MFS transporter [Treponema primitia]|uniref:MFS transporter n=1 Tax=Treponema primitia TaxID=88058 RepID=UPI00025550D4|nr:MFS transporter [Treponema primitia]
MFLVLVFFWTYIAYAPTSYIAVMVRGLGYSPSIVGILLGIFEGAGIAGPFLFGYFADKWGRYKPGLILTFSFLAIAGIPLGLFRNPLASALFIAILGMGYRSSTPLLDAVATISLGNTGNYGKVRAFGSISYIIMVLFLQYNKFLVSDTSRNIGIWFLLSGCVATLTVLIIPAKYTGNGRPRIAAIARKTSGGTALQAAQSTKSSPRRILSPLFIMGLLIIGFSRLAMAPINGFLPLYVFEAMQWNAVGLISALAATAEVPFMFISGKLIRRFGALPLVAFSSAAVGLRLGIYALFPVKGAIIAGQLLHSFCFGIFHPAAVAFISSSVPPERRALGLSLYLSLGCGLPTMLGNITGGIIIEHWGYRTLFTSFISFALISIALYLFTRFHRRRNEA